MTGFGNNNLNAQTKGYKSKTGKFSFKYFEDWIVEETDGRVTVFAPKDGPRDIHRENWGISMAPANYLSLEECYKKYILDAFPDTFNKFKIIDEGKDDHNGIPGQWIKYSFEENNQEISNLTTLLVHKDQLFILIGYSLSADFNSKYAKLFSDMMITFRVHKD